MTFGDALTGFTDHKKQTVSPRSASATSAAGTFSAFIYTCTMLNVDWDGAPNAYGLDRPGFPDQTGLDPWESPAHGGRLKWARLGGSMSKEWVGLLAVTKDKAIDILRQSGLIPPAPKNGPDVLSQTSKDLLAKFWDNRGDADSKETVPTEGSLENVRGDGKFPIVQIAEMQTTKRKGYYVSTTSAPADRSKKEWDPARYLDASTVPFMVVPALTGVKMGDFGMVIRNATGAAAAFVCGDSSGSTNGSTVLGECSGAVFIAMGKQNEGKFSFIVFPSSGTGSITGARAAETAVRSRMGILTGSDADDLGRQLSGDITSNFVVYNNIRKGMSQLGAPRFVPQVDAISGAGRR